MMCKKFYLVSGTYRIRGRDLVVSMYSWRDDDPRYPQGLNLKNMGYSFVNVERAKKDMIFLKIKSILND